MGVGPMKEFWAMVATILVCLFGRCIAKCIAAKGYYYLQIIISP